MHASKTRRSAKFAQMGLCGVLMAVTALTSGSADEVKVATPTQAFAAEFSVLPKAGPTWQRPAPLTWSSRLNVRLEARWGADGRYIA